MTKEQVREKLLKCHEQENELNKKIHKLDIIISHSNKEKRILAKKVSKNMLYRNQLISKL